MLRDIAKRAAVWETLPFLFRKSVSKNVSTTRFYGVLLSDTISNEMQSVTLYSIAKRQVNKDLSVWSEHRTRSEADY